MISYPSKGGKQCPWIAIRLPALLVVGIPQAPMNAEFHSAATHFANSLYSVNETSFYSDSKPFEGMDACLNAFLIVLAVSSPRFRAASITS